jgi:CBS domain-containing protein
MMDVRELMTGPDDALVCATRDETLARMASMISHHNVGALLIVDQAGKLCGLVSERDLVRALALDGHAAMTLRAAELMTRELISVRPDATAESARRLMLKHGIRHLPVTTRQGDLLGVISQRDLLAASSLATQRPRAA